MIKILRNWLINSGIPESLSNTVADLITFALILLISFIAFIITKKVVLRILAHYIKNNRFKWDDIMLDNKVFDRLSHLVPAIILFSSAGFLPAYSIIIQKLSLIYMLTVLILVANAFLNSMECIYNSFEVSKFRPIRGIIQVIKIFVYIIAGILLVSIIIDRSPLLLLSGIGALTAVILLVFRDSLLGLVGGIQLSANDMVRIGDWIEMPKYNADGDIIDISLNTVKVRNFDNTITMIPTYTLVSDSFKNWRGMQESGGRRIKRSVYIDTSSIKFCTEEMLNRYKRFNYIKEYIDNKLIELEEHNTTLNIDPAEVQNGRHLTNVGTFRAYLQAYLQNNPHIHKNMSLMVRQLAPTENGLPIEIYVFAKEIEWAKYEAIQSDIFDHILAIVPLFDLRIHQNPTGYDMRNMTAVLSASEES